MSPDYGWPRKKKGADDRFSHKPQCTVKVDIYFIFFTIFKSNYNFIKSALILFSQSPYSTNRISGIVKCGISGPLSELSN